MNEHIPHLRAIPSIGPIEGRDPATGAPDDLATPCAGCQRIVQPGEPIVKYRRTWWHQTCATRDVSAGNARAAWLALGHDLARSPRSYRVGEARAIVGALLGMVYDPDDPWAAEEHAS